MTIVEMRKAIRSLLSCSRGAAMVEYALLARLIAVVALTTLSGLGNAVSNQFSAISGSI